VLHVLIRRLGGRKKKPKYHIERVQGEGRKRKQHFRTLISLYLKLVRKKSDTDKNGDNEGEDHNNRGVGREEEAAFIAVFSFFILFC